jgi:acetyltransferase
MPHPLSALIDPKHLLVLYSADAPAFTPPTCTVTTVQVDSRGQFETTVKADAALLLLNPSVLLATLRCLVGLKAARAVIVPGDLTIELSDAARLIADDAGLMLIGPHAFGLQRPHLGLNASLAPELAKAGEIALLSQSSSLAAAMLDWAADTNAGFSLAISCPADGPTGIANLLDFCALDGRTNAVVVYLDDVGSTASAARRFMSALRACASVKPVVVLKPSGRGQPTDGLSVSVQDAEAVFSTALARAGAVRVWFFIQLFSAVKVLTATHRPVGRRLTILSNSGAAARLAADWGSRVRVQPRGVDLDDHPDAALRLTHWLRQVEDGLADPNADALLLLLTPGVASDSIDALAQACAAASETAGKPVLTCVLGDATARPQRHVFEACGVPSLRTPEAAVDAFAAVATFRYNQELLQQIPAPMAGLQALDLDDARQLIQSAQAAGERELSSRKARALLAALDLPVLEAAPVRLADDVVALDLAVEVRRDALFGPIFLFGAGGPLSHLLADPARELAPLNLFLAQRLIERSRTQTALAALPEAAEVQAELEAMLLHLSEAVCELPQIEHLEINPLHVVHGRLVIGGANVSLRPVSTSPAIPGRYAHMAIHPYPAGLITQQTLRNGDVAGQPWELRPIRPEDAQALQVFIRGLSLEARYMRFISALRELTPRMLQRYTQIDYDREMAFVATLPNPLRPQAERIIGMSHYLLQGDGKSAEYALVVCDDMQRQGIGAALMRALEVSAVEKGLQVLEGYVLGGNEAMLGLMRYLGYSVEPYDEEPSMRRVFKQVAPASA